jgi:hypothetical protein
MADRTEWLREQIDDAKQEQASLPDVLRGSVDAAVRIVSSVVNDSPRAEGTS